MNNNDNFKETFDWWVKLIVIIVIVGAFIESYGR